MVFIWGSKGSWDELGYSPSPCPSCDTLVIMRVGQAKKKFTLYWIPTFSYSSKQIITCLECNGAWEVTDDGLKQHIRANLYPSLSLAEQGKDRLIHRLIEEAQEETDDSPHALQVGTPQDVADAWRRMFLVYSAIENGWSRQYFESQLGAIDEGNAGKTLDGMSLTSGKTFMGLPGYSFKSIEKLAKQFNLSKNKLPTDSITRFTSNICNDCSHSWQPRGRLLAQRCPKCSSQSIALDGLIPDTKLLEPYASNIFRVLNLSSTTSNADIRKKINEAQIKLRLNPGSLGGISSDDLVRANTELLNPEVRKIHEGIWFVHPFPELLNGYIPNPVRARGITQEIVDISEAEVKDRANLLVLWAAHSENSQLIRLLVGSAIAEFDNSTSQQKLEWLTSIISVSSNRIVRLIEISSNDVAINQLSAALCWYQVLEDHLPSNLVTIQKSKFLDAIEVALKRHDAIIASDEWKPLEADKLLEYTNSRITYFQAIRESLTYLEAPEGSLVGIAMDNLISELRSISIHFFNDLGLEKNAITVIKGTLTLSYSEVNTVKLLGDLQAMQRIAGLS